MTKSILLLPLIALAAVPAAARPRTDVTRFFLASDVQRGTVEADSAGGSLQVALYRDAIARQLDRRGFAPGGESARYVYAIEFSQVPRVNATRRSPVSVGIGGSTGGYYGGGVGGGISFGIGGKPRDTLVTRVSVQLRERGGSTVWEGRAETEDKANVDERKIADRLANALFRDFPGVNGRTITVR